MDQTILMKIIVVSVIWISMAIIGAFNKNFDSGHLLKALLLGLISSCVIVTGAFK